MDNTQVHTLYQDSALVLLLTRHSNHRFILQLQSGYTLIAKFGTWPNVAIALSVLGL